MAFNESPWHLTTFALVFSCLFMCSHQATEPEILLKFKDSLANTAPLSNWNTSINVPCTGDKGNWVGVICSDGKVLGIQLENMSLSGIIDIDSLAALPLLRTLSFINNNLDGPFPNVKKLGPLKSIFLSNNKFSGEIPDDAFIGMGSLKKLYLSNNQFTGKIPSSLLKPPKLLELRLDGNKFEGRIPDFQQKDLKSVNLSNNQLEGPIPARLSKMSEGLFSDNRNLCGEPLDVCGKKPSYALIIIIVIVVLIALGLLGAVFIVLRGKHRNEAIQRSGSVKLPKKVDDGDKMELGATDGSAPKKAATEQAGKLIFVRDDRERFDLQDLLRASAEVLGSGSFGSSYKAVLLTGPSMVVKRFRHMNNVGREEFQEHMRRLGRLTHPNLLSLVSYYYRKEEKLLVHDFVENGSLAYQLHGNRTPDRPGLDWPTRLKIVKGVARGLVYLYNELPSLIVPHGHLKSSNVLLNESFDPLLTDYALVPLINQEHATQLMVAYKSPEYIQFGRTTKKTDVWSFGILILEMLTGKYPANYLKQVKGSDNGDLASWVNSVVKDEWSTEVFDKDMKETKNGEEEMLKLLKIGLGCCEEDVEKRWDLKEALDKIEDLKERDSTGDGDSSSSSSSSYSSTEGDLYSKAMPEDDHGFSISLKS